MARMKPQEWQNPYGENDFYAKAPPLVFFLRFTICEYRA